MPYSKVKVYSDGGHYIGIPYKPNPSAGKRRVQTEEMVTVYSKKQITVKALLKSNRPNAKQTIRRERLSRPLPSK